MKDPRITAMSLPPRRFSPRQSGPEPGAGLYQTHPVPKVAQPALLQHDHVAAAMLCRCSKGEQSTAVDSHVAVEHPSVVDVGEPVYVGEPV